MLRNHQLHKGYPINDLLIWSWYWCQWHHIFIANNNNFRSTPAVSHMSDGCRFREIYAMPLASVFCICMFSINMSFLCNENKKNSGFRTLMAKALRKQTHQNKTLPGRNKRRQNFKSTTCSLAGTYQVSFTKHPILLQSKVEAKRYNSINKQAAYPVINF